MRVREAKAPESYPYIYIHTLNDYTQSTLSVGSVPADPNAGGLEWLTGGNNCKNYHHISRAPATPIIPLLVACLAFLPNFLMSLLCNCLQSKHIFNPYKLKGTG